MSSSVMSVRDVSKHYRRTVAVDQVSLDLEAGQIFGLVGENGAGKTTLIRLVTGLARPTSGVVELFGHGGRDAARQRSRTGSLVETAAAGPDLSAARNLEALRIQRGLPRRDFVEQALHLTGLEATGSKKVREFSLGMRQRLGLAMALMGRPELLVLDEPTNSLDPTWTMRVRDELVRRVHEDGATVLISSHLLAELDLFATDYGFIHHGRLIRRVGADRLHQECRRTLRIRTDDVSRAATVLEERIGVRDFAVNGDGVLTIGSHLDEAARINRELVDAGVGVHELGLRGASLEDYFTELVAAADSTHPVRKA
ncbi:ABC transporter ATP-binding protein [Acidipropionibacterium virtanenii]|uniref:ABC transporter ATP-binding protein NatA n=1 Tax=Acidipropionibacterium virtanenii TaxID=2057246 RepID=A0A344UQ35_9ACTN|nr:ABC transporter ATP-binding protein [Acidipropionibacterium virtanenii]AXE37383.1 ABC transporter ATP-binding protein NatA [Acidipropionibacterium virtanenii]